MHLKVLFKASDRQRCFGISPKMAMVMKLTCFLMLVGCLQVSAAALGQKVTITGKQITLKQVFKQIREQTGYNFIYSNKTIREATPVTLDVKDVSVQEALNQVFAGQPLSYSILDKIIIVSPRTEATAKAELPDKQITGQVTDAATKKPLIGVTIQVKGTTIGTTTDRVGKFSLSVPDNAVLIVSYLGYTSKEVPVGRGNNIDISLSALTTGLNQLVVVGYETMKKKDVTGAISSISAKDLVMSSAPDVGHMLEGKLPGLFIQQNSAQPGGGLNMLIRGGGSINASNAPLIVINGFPVTDIEQPGTGGVYQGGTFSVLNSLNPNDIESITILKDASATAIYGSRAANGVILITTKSGEEGKPIVQYSANYSIQPYVNKFKELNLSQWMQVYNQASWENWLWTNQVQPWGPNTVAEAQSNPLAGEYSQPFSQKAIANVGPGTDWVGLVTRTGITMQHNLSVSGGSQAVKYFLSGNYYDQDGVVKNSALKRLSFMSNVILHKG